MYYLNFCTVGSFIPFTNFQFFNKDVYPEKTTVIEIEKTLKFPLADFRHLVYRHNKLVLVLMANLHTVDQLNLATAKFDDFIIFNILVTAKTGEFRFVRKVDFCFFSRPSGENHISTPPPPYLPAITKSEAD